MALPERISYQHSTLLHPSRINLVVGKNGSGKSRFLRNLSQVGDGTLSYITPERGGPIERDAGVDKNNRRQPEQVETGRRQNQQPTFRRQSAFRLSQLFTDYTRRVHDDEKGLRGSDKTFESEHLSRINAMLSNIQVDRRGGTEFVFYQGEQPVSPSDISSGESEAISLATEVLWFASSCKPGVLNVLYLDEPDVHLHPDLQAQLARFIYDVIDGLPLAVKGSTCVCIATHSTALVSAFASMPSVSVGVKVAGDDVVTMTPIGDELPKISPFFGHPLSQILAEDRPVIVEGDDDWRVWQQAERSSQRRLRIYPCVAETVTKQTALEAFCQKMLLAIYDHAYAVSIRDGDGTLEALDHFTGVRRFRLRCYEVENMLVTDEALAIMRTTWPDLQRALDAWSGAHPGDDRTELVNQLTRSGDRMRHRKIKSLRELILQVSGMSTTAWEVVVGRAIASIERIADPILDSSIVSYLGTDLLESLNFPAPPAGEEGGR